MFSHDEIWVAIDKLADSSGYSTSGLAKKAGLDATAFNRSKRMSPEGKPRWPSTESLAKILAVTNVTMYEFISLINIDASQNSAASSLCTIPFLNLSSASNDAVFTKNGYPQGEDWDSIELPSINPNDEDCYALEINNTTHTPLYRKGDIVIISPSASIRRGDRVLVKAIDGEVFLSELIQKTTSKIELKPLNESKDTQIIEPSNVQWVARVMWVSQ